MSWPETWAPTSTYCDGTSVPKADPAPEARLAARPPRLSHFSVLRDISPPSVEPSQRMSGSFRFDHNFTDHVLMIVSVEGDRAGVPAGASPAGCKIERVTLTGASKR